MIPLLLASLDHRADLTAVDRDRTPVPGWLTPGGWDPTTEMLRAWAAATL